MNNLTTREQWLLRLLPAIIVGIGYGLYYQRGDELTAHEAALEAARMSAVTQDRVFVEQQRLNDLAAEAAKVKEEVAQFEKLKTRTATGDRWQPVVSAEVFRRVTDLLWSHGLVDFREVSVESDRHKFPKPLQDILATMVPANKTLDKPRLWRVDFVGRYSEVLAALQMLSDSDLPAMPLRITMESLELGKSSSPLSSSGNGADSPAIPSWQGPMLASVEKPAESQTDGTKQVAESAVKEAPLRVWSLYLWL